MNNDTKQIIALILILVFILLSNVIYFDKAFAQELSFVAPIDIAAGAAYALWESYGYSLTGVGTVTNIHNWMVEQIGNYSVYREESIVDIFTEDALIKTATGVMIAQQAYEGLKDFLSWLSDELGFPDSGSKEIANIINGGDYSEVSRQNTVSETGFSVNTYGYEFGTGTSGYVQLAPYYDGVQKAPAEGFGIPILGWYPVKQENGKYRIYYAKTDGRFVRSQEFTINENPNTTYSINVDVTQGAYLPTIQNNQAWVSDFGESAVDVGQVIQWVEEEVVAGTLDVTGEIIDIAPAPTPAPSFPPGSTELEGINIQIEQGNVQLSQNQEVVEGLNDLAEGQDQMLEGINDLVDSQDSVVEGLNDIVAGQETISGALDDVNTGIETLVDSVTDSLSVPTSSQVASYKFDLRTLFPFCIPFDIYNMLRAFDGVAAAPHFEIPIVIQSIGFSYTMDLDFAMFNSVAAVLRQVELIVFAVALAYATSKVIRW